jgi:HK97 family phage portal protein
MVATIKPQLVRPSAGGTEVVENHPAAIALSRPGDLHTTYEMRQLMMTGVGFGGNGYARVHRAANGDPGELEWISPNDVSVERLPGQRFLTYRVSGQYSGNAILDRYDMIHVRGLSCDGIKGVSPVAQLRESIGITISQRQAAGAMMSNGAKFSGFIEMLPSTTDKQLQDVRDAWRKHQEGSLNAGKTPVLWGAQFKPVTGMSARDAEFLESRAFEFREICRLYRIPSFLIGDTDKATSFGTGIEEQNLAFRAYSLTPWLVNWEQSLGYTLLTTEEQRAGYRFEFDREEIETFTLASKASFVSQMRTASIFSPNDGREWLGYNRTNNPEMDNYLAPLNSASSGAAAPQEKANPKMQPANA